MPPRALPGAIPQCFSLGTSQDGGAIPTEETLLGGQRPCPSGLVQSAGGPADLEAPAGAHVYRQQGKGSSPDPVGMRPCAMRAKCGARAPLPEKNVGRARAVAMAPLPALPLLINGIADGLSGREKPEPAGAKRRPRPVSAGATARINLAESGAS